MITLESKISTNSHDAVISIEALLLRQLTFKRDTLVRPEDVLKRTNPIFVLWFVHFLFNWSLFSFLHTKGWNLSLLKDWKMIFQRIEKVIRWNFSLRLLDVERSLSNVNFSEALIQAILELLLSVLQSRACNISPMKYTWLCKSQMKMQWKNEKSGYTMSCLLN